MKIFYEKEKTFSTVWLCFGKYAEKWFLEFGLHIKLLPENMYICPVTHTKCCGVGGVDLVGLSEQRESFGGTPSLTSPVGPSGRACCSTPFPHYQLFLLFEFLFFFLFSRYLLLYTSLVRITNNLVFLFTCSFFFLFSFFPVICSFLFLLELPKSAICKNQKKI